MLQLVKDVSGDLSMDWLKPFMTEHKCKAGEMPLIDLSGAMAEARTAAMPDPRQASLKRAIAQIRARNRTRCPRGRMRFGFSRSTNL